MIEILNNPTVRIILIIAVVFLVGTLLYIKWKQILKTQELEPIFIRKVRNAKKPGQFSGQTIPISENGNSYTFMTWLHVSDWDYRRGKWKHIFHKGDAIGNNAQPGVWIDPNKNDLHIRFDTYSKPSVMKSREGFGNYLIDIIKSETSGRKDPNIIFRRNGEEMQNNKKVRTEKLTYQDILKIEPTAKEIILVLEPNVILTKNTVPLAYVILKINEFVDIAKKRTLKPSKSFPDSKGEVIYTINPISSQPSLNPTKPNSVTNTEGISNNVENFPLNRWFHLAIIANNRSCDVFIDGKLYKSSVLNNYPKHNSGDLFITQDGGFGGMITQLRYYSKAMSLKMIKFIYDLGPNPPQLPDLNALFSKYKPKFNVKLNVGVSVNGKEYDIDEMAKDTVEKGVKTLSDTMSSIDSSIDNNL